MDLKFANNVKTTLSGPILTGATDIPVVSAIRFPSLASGEYCYVTLQNPSDEFDFEIVKVTSISGTTLTGVRGQDGSVAKGWPASTLCELRMNRVSLLELESAARPTVGALTAKTLDVDGGITLAGGQKNISLTSYSGVNDTLTAINGTFSAGELVCLSAVTGHTITISATHFDIGTNFILETVNDLIVLMKTATGWKQFSRNSNG